MINALLNMNATNSTGKHTKLRTWKWGKLGNRLGSGRSADGVIIDLPYSKSTDGKNVVAKFIFASDSDFARAKQEYVIGNMMSKAGVGPKVYDYYEMIITTAMNIQNLMKKASGSDSVNLFQNNVNAREFKHCIVIIMENLYKGPGVVDTYTLHEGIVGRKVVPYEKIRSLIDKMHNLGVIHADMHSNNIMIQKIKTTIGYKYRPLLIDFGRSLKTNKSFKTNANANAFAKMNRFKSELWWYSNDPNVMPVLLNGDAWNRIKQGKKPTLLSKVAKKYRQVAQKFKKFDNSYLDELTNTEFSYNTYKKHLNQMNPNNVSKEGLIKKIILRCAKGLFDGNGLPKFESKLINMTGKDLYYLYNNLREMHKLLQKLSVSELKTLSNSF